MSENRYITTVIVETNNMDGSPAFRSEMTWTGLNYTVMQKIHREQRDFVNSMVELGDAKVEAK